MRDMELKVWVDGVQRIVCGVTEVTTCQEVVIALAQAIGRTGRYTLIEKWHETERHLAPHENPVVSLNKWGQYASDVQLVLQCTSPSLSERPTSRSSMLGPTYYPYHQSLTPLAKICPITTDSIKRCEPRCKSLPFSSSVKGLRDIFSKSREPGRGCSATPGPVVQELGRLVPLQKKKLNSLERKLQSCEQETQCNLLTEKEEEELLWLEQQVQEMETEVQEQEFWENELQLEQENERKLREQLQQLIIRFQECKAELSVYMAQIQCMETCLQAEQLQRELLQMRKANKEDLWVQMENIDTELKMQVHQAARLESSCRAVNISLGQFNLQLQKKEQELDQLTKELRHVNLQQFIQQTGTKVTVLPAELMKAKSSREQSSSLQPLESVLPLSTDLQSLQSPLTSSFNPDGIYV
ncbi:ras association domain-containing protein 8b isoform X2 [Trichomycterus rosablanca]|uniref:ras association domain-containing protein 8b isoform X2 n=1 Tax=Trichomycterus rosablanca TaxID=2290929 RepID=UPI002F352DC7